MSGEGLRIEDFEPSGFISPEDFLGRGMAVTRRVPAEGVAAGMFMVDILRNNSTAFSRLPAPGEAPELYNAIKLSGQVVRLIISEELAASLSKELKDDKELQDLKGLIHSAEDFDASDLAALRQYLPKTPIQPGLNDL